MLPAKALSQRKRCFGFPLKVWLRKELKEYVHDRLFLDNDRLSGCLNMDSVRKIVRDHDAGLRDLNHKVWSILVFDAWLEQYTRS